MKTLHLTLKKKWFDMIASGEKTEEYREVKPYWIQRLCDPYPGNIGGDFMDSHSVTAYLFKKFDSVIFRNGYSKNAPVMSFKVREISHTYGFSDWGAEHHVKYFVIKLGEKL